MSTNPPEPDDGARVPADRLWPRGPARDAARVDEWPEGLPPPQSCAAGTTQPTGRTRSSASAMRRNSPLRRPPNSWTPFREPAGRGPVTLLTAAKSPETGRAEAPARLPGD
ncbi:DUF488 family protein, N3 subclade [Streptomyces pimonensis]|uniref:DUF488 family protein, N3 subclade n=1 Tax=Streptomyces pimonensis TaxID=2860288 RepID=UPI003528E71A